MQAILERFDTDGDGELSAEERSAMRRARGGRLGGVTAKSDTAKTEVPQELKSLYKATEGPHQVDSISSLKLDVAHRPGGLPIRITYPKSTGRFPVIVFSHGAYGSKDGYDPIVKHWARHGYIVIQGTHGDSLSLVSAAEKLRVATSRNPFVAMPIEKHWKTRAQDVTTIIDSLDKLESMHAPIRGKIDASKIGMGGHSYGSNTTQLVCGLNFGVDLKNDKINAMLLLSPPGPNARLGANAYKNMSLPLMTVTGSKDNVAGRDQEYTDRLKTHENIPSREKYLLFMDDAQHNLGGVSGSAGRMSGGGFNASHLTCVKSATTAFWDHQLKSHSAAKAFLKSGKVARATKGLATIK